MGFSAYEIPSFYVGVLEANVAMGNQTVGSGTVFQYTGVDAIAATGTGLVGPAAIGAPLSSGAAIIGILQNNPLLAEVGAVMVHGVTKMYCGGTVTIGAILAVNALGQCVAAASTNFGIGKALQAGTSGQIIPVLLLNLGKQ